MVATNGVVQAGRGGLQPGICPPTTTHIVTTVAAGCIRGGDSCGRQASGREQLRVVHEAGVRQGHGVHSTAAASPTPERTRCLHYHTIPRHAHHAHDGMALHPGRQHHNQSCPAQKTPALAATLQHMCEVGVTCVHMLSSVAAVDSTPGSFDGWVGLVGWPFTGTPEVPPHPGCLCCCVCCRGVAPGRVLLCR